MLLHALCTTCVVMMKPGRSDFMQQTFMVTKHVCADSCISGNAAHEAHMIPVQFALNDK